MADVFVSYQRADRTRAEAIVGLLEAAGLSVWWDQALDAGDRFDSVIARELRQARCVVVAWSATSVASHWVRDEAADGRDRGILVPCCLDDTAPPLGFRQFHATDLRAWPDAADDPRARQLVDAVRRVVKKIAGHQRVHYPPTRRGRRRPGEDATAGMAAVEALATATEQLWLEASRTWSLSEDAPVMVSRDRSMRSTMLSADVVEQLYSEVYDRPEQRVVVIAGEAGIGKSTAMLLLLRHAIRERRRSQVNERGDFIPVPVWLTFGDWGAEESLTGYATRTVAGMLGARRPDTFRHGVARRLVEQRRVALFLDGLDELPDGRRERAAKQINVLARNTRVVLTLRPSKRGIAHDRRPFDASVLVRLHPVDANTAAAFLTRDEDTATDRPALRELAAILRTDPGGPVAKALRTPLTIGLARDAFGTARTVGFTPTDLTALASPRDVVSRLVGLFLDRAYSLGDAEGSGWDQRRRARLIARERAAMTWVARRMGANRDLAWWRMPTWVARNSISLRTGYLAMALMVVISLVSWPILDPFGRAFSLGLAGTVYFIVEVRCRKSIGKPPSTLRWRWPPLRDLRKVMATATSGGLLAGVTMAWLGSGLSGAAMMTGSIFLMGVLCAALSDEAAAAGLLASSTISLADSPALTPRDAYLVDRRRTVRTAVVGALAGGLLMAPLGLVEDRLSMCVLFGACMGLIWGWVGGLGPSCLLALTRPRLPGTRRSVRLMPTLRHAVDKKVLRQAGLVYQFRHAAFQDYLCRWTDADDATIRLEELKTEAADAR